MTWAPVSLQLKSLRCVQVQRFGRREVKHHVWSPFCVSGPERCVRPCVLVPSGCSWGDVQRLNCSVCWVSVCYDLPECVADWSSALLSSSSVCPTVRSVVRWILDCSVWDLSTMIDSDTEASHHRLWFVSSSERHCYNDLFVFEPLVVLLEIIVFADRRHDVVLVFCFLNTSERRQTVSALHFL